MIDFDDILPEKLMEFSSEINSLVLKARQAAENAYAPYSEFRVGASLLTESGDILSGNNQENMAYPSGLCAERVTFFAAGARYPDTKFKAVAIFSPDLESDALPVTPCGACRQVMFEYELRQKQPIALYLISRNGDIYKIDSVKALLPFAFRLPKP